LPPQAVWVPLHDVPHVPLLHTWFELHAWPQLPQLS